MEHRDNYRIQAEQAKAFFSRYGQNSLIRKLSLPFDDRFLYPRMLGEDYRICRRTGDIRRLHRGIWVDANSHGEVLTLLDLVCDSREDRYLTGSWKNILAFGHQFHRQLMEEADPNARYFEEHLPDFHRACRAMGGVPFPHCDAGYTIELFDGLSFALQLWLGDEDFPAQLRYLLDENAHMYLKYETMHYAKALLLRRIREEMGIL